MALVDVQPDARGNRPDFDLGELLSRVPLFDEPSGPEYYAPSNRVKGPDGQSDDDDFPPIPAFLRTGPATQPIDVGNDNKVSGMTRALRDQMSALAAEATRRLPTRVDFIDAFKTFENGHPYSDMVDAGRYPDTIDAFFEVLKTDSGLYITVRRFARDGHFNNMPKAVANDLSDRWKQFVGLGYDDVAFNDALVDEHTQDHIDAIMKGSRIAFAHAYLLKSSQKYRSQERVDEVYLTAIQEAGWQWPRLSLFKSAEETETQVPATPVITNDDVVTKQGITLPHLGVKEFLQSARTAMLSNLIRRKEGASSLWTSLQQWAANYPGNMKARSAQAWENIATVGRTVPGVFRAMPSDIASGFGRIMENTGISRLAVLASLRRHMASADVPFGTDVPLVVGQTADSSDYQRSQPIPVSTSPLELLHQAQVAVDEPRAEAQMPEALAGLQAQLLELDKLFAAGGQQDQAVAVDAIDEPTAPQIEPVTQQALPSLDGPLSTETFLARLDRYAGMLFDNPLTREVSDFVQHNRTHSAIALSILAVAASSLFPMAVAVVAAQIGLSVAFKIGAQKAFESDLLKDTSFAQHKNLHKLMAIMAAGGVLGGAYAAFAADSLVTDVAVGPVTPDATVTIIDPVQGSMTGGTESQPLAPNETPTVQPQAEPVVEATGPTAEQMAAARAELVERLAAQAAERAAEEAAQLSVAGLNSANSAILTSFQGAVEAGTLNITDSGAIQAFNTLQNAANPAEALSGLERVVTEQYTSGFGARADALALGNHVADIARDQLVNGTPEAQQQAQAFLERFAWYCQNTATNTRLAGDFAMAHDMFSSSMSDMRLLAEHGSGNVAQRLADNIAEVNWELTRVTGPRLT